MRLSFKSFFSQCKSLSKKAHCVILIFAPLYLYSKDINRENFEAYYNSQDYPKVLELAHETLPQNRDKTWQKYSLLALKESLIRYPHRIQTPVVLNRLIELGQTSPLNTNKEFINALTPSLIDSFQKNPKLRNDILAYFALISSHSNQYKFVAITPLDSTIIQTHSFTSILNSLASSEFSDIYCKNPHFNHFFENQKSKKSGQSKCWKSFASKFLQKDHLQGKSKIISMIIADRAFPLEARIFLAQRYILTSTLGDSSQSIAKESFNNLRDNRALRQVTLRKIQGLKHIPDEAFSKRNLSNVSLILQYQQNFPEFLDYYLKSCYLYLKGFNQNNNGNPTKECLNVVKVMRRFKVSSHKGYLTKIQENFPYLLK